MKTLLLSASLLSNMCFANVATLSANATQYSIGSNAIVFANVTTTGLQPSDEYLLFAHIDNTPIQIQPMGTENWETVPMTLTVAGQNIFTLQIFSDNMVERQKLEAKIIGIQNQIAILEAEISNTTDATALARLNAQVTMDDQLLGDLNEQLVGLRKFVESDNLILTASATPKDIE